MSSDMVNFKEILNEFQYPKKAKGGKQELTSKIKILIYLFHHIRKLSSSKDYTRKEGEILNYLVKKNYLERFRAMKRKTRDKERDRYSVVYDRPPYDKSIRNYIEDIKNKKGDIFTYELDELKELKKTLNKEKHTVAYVFNLDNIFYLFTTSIENNFSDYSKEVIINFIYYIRKYLNQLEGYQLDIKSNNEYCDYLFLVNYLHTLHKNIHDYLEIINLLNKKQNRVNNFIIIPRKGYSINQITKLILVDTYLGITKGHEDKRSGLKESDMSLHLKEGSIYNIGFLWTKRKKLENSLFKSLDKEDIEEALRDYKRYNLDHIRSMWGEIYLSISSHR